MSITKINQALFLPPLKTSNNSANAAMTNSVSEWNIEAKLFRTLQHRSPALRGILAVALSLRLIASQFFHQRQPPSKLQTSPLNLRKWISRLWAFYGKPIREKMWFRLNVWMKRLYLKNPEAVAQSTAGGRSGCCC
jgi:hypothetical protein